MMQLVPSVNQAYAMINQDESQKVVAGTSRMMDEYMDPTAMFTSRSGNGNRKQKKSYNSNSYCEFCHMKGHLRVDCYKLVKCDSFHKTGHVMDDYYRLHGYPDDFKGTRKANAVAGNTNFDGESVRQQDVVQPLQNKQV